MEKINFDQTKQDVKSQKKDYSMYDFLEKNATGYDNMYTILARYIPQLNGDFSTANLVNKLIESANYTEDPKMILTDYPTSFDKLASMLLIASDSSIGIPNKYQSIDRELSEEEKKSLLAKFHELDLGDNLSTIRDYIDYAKNNIEKPELADLRSLIVESAVEVANKKEMLTLRHKLLSYVYVPQAMNQLKVKYPSFADREGGNYPEWNEVDFIARTFRNINSLEKYDKYLEKHKENVAKFKKDDAISLFCESKRNQQVTSNIIASMNNEDAEQAKKEGFENVIFDNLKNSGTPREGSTSWRIALFQEPEVLLDTFANYSKNGIENQRVIAVSYGKFHYANKISDNSLIQPDLVGVTRIGRDGVKSYFTIIPLDTISFRDSTEELKEGEKRYNFYFNGKKNPFGNAVYSRRIPRDLVEFYTQTFLSDEYLNSAIENNYRYTGYVSKTPKGPVIIASDIARLDLDAAKYASIYPGLVGVKNVASLDEYCKSEGLQKKHLRIVNEISNGRYEYDSQELIADADIDEFNGDEQGEPR